MTRASLQACAVVEAPWRDPVAAAAGAADAPFTLLLLSDGRADGRWSYLMRSPVETFVGADAFEAAREALGTPLPTLPDGPPFQGGLAGLASYEFGAVLEPAMPQGRTGWPDMAVGLYAALLAFDHRERRLLAVGRAATHDAAESRARSLLDELPAMASHRELPPADRFDAVEAPETYEAAVADVVEAIRRGEIFQANVARAWAGRLRPEARPFDVLTRLQARSPAPFAAYMRLPGGAVISNSPERFVSLSANGGRLHARTQPIKGTRPRGPDPATDAANAAALLASAKDRAENLMIVDLMRNDLARVCEPGSVEAPELFRLQSLANVHHLVSTVTGVLAPGRTALDLFAAAFPPGSVTGAPKIQAMRVIARHEPPRGPYCGSLFWAGVDGAFDSSVLIRTLAFTEESDGWAFEARAGAGIVADSDPASERAETDAKIAALRDALAGA